MLTKSKFEELITLPESILLDYKKEMYDLSSDDKTACLVKDIISMINTKRASTSYIIIGVDAKANGENTLLGINDHIDDAILQEKIKNKIVPTPIFEYYAFECDNMKFGVFEFPVTQYKTFLSCPLKLKGLEPSIPYYRLGSSNQKAEGHKVIEIHEWITTNSKQKDEDQLSKEDLLMDILHQLNDDEEPLSKIILDGYEYGITYNVDALLNFCSTEIKGVSPYSTAEKYRTVGINYCYGRFDNIKNEHQTVWERRLLSENNYFVIDHIIKSPVSEIEKSIKEAKANGATMVLDTKLSYFHPHIQTEDNKGITVFLHLSTLNDVRSKIKEQYLRILMTLY